MGCDDVTIQLVEEVIGIIETCEKGDPGTTLPQNQIDALNAANSPSAANAFATFIDLFLLAGQAVGDVTGASSSYAPFPNKYHIISEIGADAVHTLTLSAANLTGKTVGSMFAIKAADSYGAGKILRVSSLSISIDLMAGDSVLVQWNGGTAYSIVSANQNTAVARAYINKGSKDKEFPIPYAAAVAIDFAANGNEQYVNATGALEITAFNNFPDGGKLEFNMFHIGGPWTLTLPAGVDNAGDISIAGTAGGWDTLIFRKSNGILSGFLAESK